MDNRSLYGNFKVTKETMKYLQNLKSAFEIYYGKEMTNDEFIKQMATSLNKGDSCVWEIFCEMQKNQQRLVEMAAMQRTKFNVTL